MVVSGEKSRQIFIFQTNNTSKSSFEEFCFYTDAYSKMIESMFESSVSPEPLSRVIGSFLTNCIITMRSMHTYAKLTGPVRISKISTRSLNSQRSVMKDFHVVYYIILAPPIRISDEQRQSLLFRCAPVAPDSRVLWSGSIRLFEQFIYNDFLVAEQPLGGSAAKVYTNAPRCFRRASCILFGRG